MAWVRFSVSHAAANREPSQPVEFCDRGQPLDHEVPDEFVELLRLFKVQPVVGVCERHLRSVPGEVIFSADDRKQFVRCTESVAQSPLPLCR